MKRHILTITLFAFALASLSAKTKLTVKNTVGADLDELGEYDLFTRTNETDVTGDTTTNTGFSFGDRLQADVEDDLFNARIRLEAFYQNMDDSLANVIFAPSGYFHFTPVSQFGIVAGTNFYKHFAIQSGYLAASDDTTKYARLLTDSLGEERYFGNDTVAIFSNGFAGGITSDWNFNNGIYTKFAGGGTFYPDSDEFEKAIDFGVNGGVSNLFDVGFTAHDVTEDSRKFGAFLGYTGSENLIANVGFYYNFTTSDYLPEERVDHKKKGYSEYKKQSTKYALGFSGGYDFTEKGFKIYADVITGLTNEYIGKIKYYDSDGNLTKTEIGTIARGSTIVKYKSSKNETDDYTHEGIPFYAGLRMNYQISDSMEALFNFCLRTLLHAESTTWITLYPRLSIGVGESGTIGAGLRFDMNAARSEGISGISIPLTYTYKFKKKF
ncbi:MAG: hypothetical protein IJ158_09740 [Treponema sp.]|nr:hypothetical protein [Treponema sp.]